MYMKKKLNLAALLLAAALLGACGGQKQDAADTVAQTESAETENADQKSSIELADGVYTVDFKTDSSMFKVNESKNGKGVQTVTGGFFNRNPIAFCQTQDLRKLPLWFNASG